MKKKTRPHAIGAVLKALLPSMQGCQSSPEYLMLCALWRETVGEAVAAHTCPAAVRKETLTVHVTSPVWMQQLHFLRDEILEKLNPRLSPKALKDIRFKIGPVPGAKQPREPLPPLSSHSRRGVEETAAAIADPDLRSAFKGFMEAYLKNRQDQ